MEWLRQWLPVETAHWVIWSLGVGFGLIILVGVVRTAHYVYYYGLWNWLKGSFRINDDTWWLIAVLIMLASSCGFIFLI